MTYLKQLSDDVRILLILAAFWMPVMALTGVYAYRDARRFGKRPVFWAVISACSPCLTGFIAYLIIRNPEGREVEEAQPTGQLLQRIMLSVLVIPALLMGLLAGVMNFTEGNYLFLTRFDTDVTITDDLIDPEYLNTENWRTITRTNADGSSVEVQQHFGNFQITRTAADGKTETTVYDVAYGGVMKGPWGRYANLEGDSYSERTGVHQPFLEGSGYYFYNDAEQLYLFEIKSDREMELEHCVSLFYDEADRVVRQQYEAEHRNEYGTLLELTPEEADLRYDLYTYNAQGKLLRSDRYDYADRPVCTTEYLWSMGASLRIARTYTLDGALTATSVSTFDTKGRLEKQEFFDGDGIWQYTVEFGNDLVSFLLLDSTTLLLAILWALTMIVTVLMLLPEKKK